jgi:RNA polymerase sigma factor (sigma-70 family)
MTAMSTEFEVKTEQEVDFIEKLKRNDDQALRSFYAANYPRVQQYVMENSGTGADARDIYQEAFIAVWRNIQLDKFRPAGDGSLQQYLVRVAKNKWLDVLRQRKKHSAVLLSADIEEIQVAEEEVVTEDRLHELKEAFRGLGTQCRDVLTRFYFKKESLRDIAAFYSWTEATAKNNKYRCIQKLRQFLKK